MIARLAALIFLATPLASANFPLPFHFDQAASELRALPAVFVLKGPNSLYHQLLETAAYAFASGDNQSAANAKIVLALLEELDN